jgi:hypothetical protein
VARSQSSSMIRPIPALAALAAVLLCGCGSNGVTATRIEYAVAPTFANLIQSQEAILGMPPLDASTLRASAACHRVGPGDEPSGGGDWSCTIEWFPPGHRGPWHDIYELSVTTDGCYTAIADGEGGHVGGPRLTTRAGITFTNMLYAFDGCFDPTSEATGDTTR